MISSVTLTGRPSPLPVFPVNGTTILPHAQTRDPQVTLDTSFVLSRIPDPPGRPLLYLHHTLLVQAALIFRLDSQLPAVLPTSIPKAKSGHVIPQLEALPSLSLVHPASHDPQPPRAHTAGLSSAPGCTWLSPFASSQISSISGILYILFPMPK